MVAEVKPADSFLTVDGVRIHVSQTGKGMPLLLVHGLGGALMYQRVIEPLSLHFRVIVIDLPGYGDSEGPDRTYTVEEHAGVLQHILHQLNIPKAFVAGVSYGGQIAAMLASLHPENVERLVLICSTGLMKTPFILANTLLRRVAFFTTKRFILTNKTRLCKTGARSFYNIASRPKDLCDKFFEQLSKPGHREAWLNGALNSFPHRESFKRIVQRITAPTLILWGENDSTIPLKHAAEFQQLIPYAKVQTFKECAHSIPLEKPDEFCGVVKGFLEK